MSDALWTRRVGEGNILGAQEDADQDSHCNKKRSPFASTYFILFYFLFFFFFFLIRKICILEEEENLDINIDR